MTSSSSSSSTSPWTPSKGSSAASTATPTTSLSSSSSSAAPSFPTKICEKQPARLCSHMVVDATCQTKTKKESADTCVVCLQAPQTHAFAPCGHLCLCQDCAARPECLHKCPLCRKQATIGVFRIHLDPRPDVCSNTSGSRAAAGPKKMQNVVIATRRSFEGPVPEWRAAQAHPKHIKGEALSNLQNMLMQNTMKEVVRPSKSAVMKDATCQTEDEDLCLSCHGVPATHAVLPCGHRCVCVDCAGYPNDRGEATEPERQVQWCPVCYTRARACVRIFDQV